MSSVMTGNPSGASNTLSATVTDASNASPIVITTSADHHFATHDLVTITGVVGNLAANGTFSITKINATSFSLDGSTGSGAYVSGGTAVDESLTPQFQVPEDGDGPIQASDVKPAFQQLANDVAFLAARARPSALAPVTWTSTTTWVAPFTGTLMLTGYGNGGSGGGGGGGDNATNSYAGSGGGGGGAVQRTVPVQVTKGTSYTITIPAAPTGGAGHTGGGAPGVGSDGVDGGDVTFAVTAGATLATFAGGGKGRGGAGANASTTVLTCAMGGTPTKGGPHIRTTCDTSKVGQIILASGPQCGGDGVSALVGSRSGFYSPQGYAGGGGGSTGADASNYRGGQGGGGGGAGPGGAGGTGGTGGAGDAVGEGDDGGNGSDAAANSGAGGGGGGAGGGGASVSIPLSGFAGGNGGAGGTGKITGQYVAVTGA